MNEQAFEALQVRLQTFERRLRLVMLVAVFSVAAVGLIGTWILTTARNPGVVRARAIEVVDETGRPLIGLDARTIDARYVIPHKKGTPILWISDREGKTRIALRINDNGEPELALCDELVRSTIVLRSLKGGIPGLWLFNASGDLLFSAP